MQAGRLKYRLELFEPLAEKEGHYGEPTHAWRSHGRVYAERVKFNGSRREEVSEMFSDYRVEFNIRDAHRVAEGWRVKQLGGYDYTVVNIEPNRDRGMLTLKCERINY